MSLKQNALLIVQYPRMGYSINQGYFRVIIVLIECITINLRPILSKVERRVVEIDKI